MEGAMDMSLDDYINSFQKVKPDEKTNNLANKEESKFKEGRRQHDDNEDEEELILQCQEDDYVSLALKNDDRLALVRTDSNDLRNKLTGRCPNSNSQQWRLMQPNVMHSRPAGMPPLVPSGSSPNNMNPNNGNRGNWRNNNNKNRNFFGRQNWNNNHNNNNHNSNNYRNNGRIQRFGNNTRSNLNSKNIKIVLEQLQDRNPMILYSEVGTPDLTIEASTSERDNRNGVTHFTFPAPIQQGVPQVGTELGPNDHSTKGSEAIKSLLGVSEVGLRNEMIPALAGKLLDFLNGVNPSVHKPQYDMKIQKEIHEIQKKPLLYKCPGGEVVSSDGAGIPNCRIQPKASGVSLNNRFA